MIKSFEVTELEDGYRIEIKGDKERIGRMIRMWQEGPRRWRGRRRRGHWHGRHHHHGGRRYGKHGHHSERDEPVTVEV